MTWQECRDITLQKLFQCFEGPDRDEATLRYLAAMPAAASEGIAQVCAVRPLRGQVVLPALAARADLSALAPDFAALGQPEVFTLEDGLPAAAVTGWSLLAGRVLCLPPQSVPVQVGYDRTPPRLPAHPADDLVLELPGDAAALLPLYIASQLYKEEDAGAAAVWRNEFELGLERLARPDPGAAADRFVSVTGWCG